MQMIMGQRFDTFHGGGLAHVLTGDISMWSSLGTSKQTDSVVSQPAATHALRGAPQQDCC